MSNKKNTATLCGREPLSIGGFACQRLQTILNDCIAAQKDILRALRQPFERVAACGQPSMPSLVADYLDAKWLFTAVSNCLIPLIDDELDRQGLQAADQGFEDLLERVRDELERRSQDLASSADPVGDIIEPVIRQAVSDVVDMVVRSGLISVMN